MERGAEEDRRGEIEILEERSVGGEEIEGV